jgi:RHS repeat-associated protein
MLAQASNSRPSPPPLPSALLAAELAPVVMADYPCEAALGGADPTGPRKYYRARYYDPRLGRFLSEDPIRFQSSDDLNLYTYVANDPVDFVDPTGEIRFPGWVRELFLDLYMLTGRRRPPSADLMDKMKEQRGSRSP